MLNRKRTIDRGDIILIINTSILCIEVGAIIYTLKNMKKAFKK